MPLRSWQKLATFCTKTQPIAGFSLAENYKKLTCMKKPVFLLPKVNFFLEGSIHRRMQALSRLTKSVLKKASVIAIELYSTSGKGSAVARAKEVARILQSLRFCCMNKNDLSTT